MVAVINDISFQYPFDAAETAVRRMHEFLDICILVEKEEDAYMLKKMDFIMHFRMREILIITATELTILKMA